MKLRLALIASVLAATTPIHSLAAQEGALTAVPPSDSALATAREIIDLGMPEEKREAIFFATMEQMMAQMREAQQLSSPIDDPQVVAILDRRLAEFKVKAMDVMLVHMPSIMDAWAVAYANIFTPEELNDIRNFVATPSGQRFFELSPAITAEPNFAAANQLYMNDVMGLLPGLQEQLKSDIMDYLSSLETGETES